MAVKVNPIEAVTPRQLELLALYASGDDIPTIAKKKFLHPRTVQNTMYKARDHLDAKSLTHLCVMLVDSGALMKNGNGYRPVPDERVVGE